mgnify:CR=1 FL=1
MNKADYIALAADLEKHKDLIEADRDLRCLRSIKDKIFKFELIEDYGWVIPEHVNANPHWFGINDEVRAGTYGGDTNRSISWEDNGKDPQGEFLLSVIFSTGAYFFGDAYDTEFFKKFFSELESYKPKFKDSHNNRLYFSKEGAGVLLQNYDNIVNKYRKLYRDGQDKRRAKVLREELRKLESNNV